MYYYGSKCNSSRKTVLYLLSCMFVTVKGFSNKHYPPIKTVMNS